MKIHRDGSVTVVIPEGYLGQCAKCFKNDATHEEFTPFDPPLQLNDGFPAIEGVWGCVCDGCCDLNAKHKDS